jgi:hypothetical protein
MTKKIVPVFLLVAICFTMLFSCKKYNNTKVDATRNYFPLTLGNYVVYNVDSTYYYGVAGTQAHVSSQIMYQMTDTFTDSKKRLSYIMNVYVRPYDGAQWVASSVILITPTANSLLYSQDGTQYIKMMFPITDSLTWQGNQLAQVQDSSFAFLKGWNYQYSGLNYSYFNGNVNYDNTVSVLEDDENVNYQNVDSLVSGYRTYAKEVYAYNVGMVYKEFTHYTWGSPDTANNKNGYRVIMSATANH